MKRLAVIGLAVTLGVTVALTAAMPAQADTVTDATTARLPHLRVGVPLDVGETTRGMVNFGARFAAIDQLCFHFVFQDDLLDPGDLLFMEGVGGFINVSTDPQAQRTLCLRGGLHDAVLEKWLDGKHRLEVLMESGSVTIVDLEVRVVGSPA